MKKKFAIFGGILTALAIGSAAFSTSYPVPGVLNVAVTQANLKTTVCVPHYTDTIRPSSLYTTDLKKKQMKTLGLKGVTADYEEDHFISLILGGHPTDPNNLWPQAYPEARYKDMVEVYLHHQVCDGRMTLKEAQEKVKNWKPIYESLGHTLGGITADEDDD